MGFAIIQVVTVKPLTSTGTIIGKKITVPKVVNSVKVACSSRPRAPCPP